jgi:DNA ligase-1
MLLADVVATSRRVAETSRRLAKVDFLAALLRRLSPGEVEPVVAILSGYIRQGRVGVGWATLRDSGAPPAERANIEIEELDGTLASLAATEGRGSERRKGELLHALFARSTEAEQKFLTGLLLGEIRQGALEGIMLDSLAKASGVAPATIRRAVMMAGDIARVARSALESGEAGLGQYDVQLFRPVQPMLAQTADDVESAIADLGEAAFEYKFDGQRVQVHRSGDDVRIFSRSLNNLTAAVPEIAEAARALLAREFILDGEVLCLAAGGRPQPFQVTAQRFGRKLDLERMRETLPLTPYWFDLLYLDGQSLMDEPQSRRFAALTELSPPLALVPHLYTGDTAQAAEFLQTALDRGHEGIMAKSRDAAYAAGARGQSWRKIKKAHTLDLVILAAEWGHGRRHGFLSNLHLGARDTAAGGFAMLGKTFKGLTDEMLAWQTEQLLRLEISRDIWAVYVEPKLVAEIAFSDIQVSRRYASGLALRFARVKRYRPDKAAAAADTLETVRKLASPAG